MRALVDRLAGKPPAAAARRRRGRRGYGAGGQHQRVRFQGDFLLGARLIDDMLPLSAQIQRASDTSKFAVSRISGVDGPKFADDEQTFAQLQQRIADTIAYLESVDTALLDAGGAREVKLNWGAKGADFTGESYLLTFALPNF